MRVSLFDLVDWRGDEYDPALAAEIYSERLDEWECAEKLGFDGVYLAEHHFSACNLSPSPNLLLAALSQRTKRIRIGVMVNVLPFHDPLRIAEETAMLDLLTQGRLDFGIGRGVVQIEFVHNRMDYDESRARFLESMDFVLGAWAEKEFKFEGKFRKIGPATIWPRPLQQPHPPIWCAALSDDTVIWAANKGYSIASILLPVEGMRRRFDLYRATARELGKKTSPDQLMVTRHTFVADSDEEARAIAEEPFNDLFRFFIPPGQNRDFSKLADDQKYYTEFYRGFLGCAMTFGDLIDAGIFIVGSPKTVTRLLTDQLRETGAGNLLCCMNFGSLRASEVRHSEELFATRVMPQLRALA